MSFTNNEVDVLTEYLKYWRREEIETYLEQLEIVGDHESLGELRNRITEPLIEKFVDYDYVSAGHYEKWLDDINFIFDQYIESLLIEKNKPPKEQNLDYMTTEIFL